VDVNKVVCTPDDDLKKDEEKEDAWWVPHPKNHIFYLEGHQKWIEDVNNHKTVHEQQTYWL
jgi:hypothetical protein